MKWVSLKLLCILSAFRMRSAEACADFYSSSTSRSIWLAPKKKGAGENLFEGRWVYQLSVILVQACHVERPVQDRSTKNRLDASENLSEVCVPFTDFWNVFNSRMTFNTGFSYSDQADNSSDLVEYPE